MEKKNLIIIVAVLAIVVIAMRSGGMFASINGFSTLSLSSVDLQSNDPEIGGQTWVLTVVQYGVGQNARGIFTTSEAATKTSGNQFINSDFQIDMNLVENYAQYPIRNDYNPIYRYNIQVATPAFLQSGEDYCAKAGASSYAKPTGTFNTYCIFRTADGTMGIIGTPNQIFVSDILFTNLKTGEVVKSTISNAGASSATVGSVGYVSWVGSLVSGFAIPDAPSQGVCALYTGLAWKTISCSDFGAWKLSIDADGIPTCLAGRDENGVKTCIQSVNNLESAVLQGRNFVSQGGTTAVVSGVAQNGSIKMQLSNQFQFPLLTLRIKASWLGIVVPVGKPKIVSVTSDPFHEGDVGLIKATIQNIGTATGGFKVYATCGSTFTSNDMVTTSLSPNDVSDVFLKVQESSGATSRTSGTCTVNVQDVNQPANKDSASVTVTADPLLTCEVGKKRVAAQFVQQCDGKNWNTIKTCPEGQYADAVTFDCVTVKPAPSLLDMISGFGNWVVTMGIIIAIIIFLILILPVILNRR